MVDVKRITDERLQSWSKKLADAHATPLLLVGVGHDHVSGQLSIIVTEDRTDTEIKYLLKKIIKELG